MFLANQAGLIRSGIRALAIADGEGRNGVWLAEQGAHVHAVDVSPVARENPQATRISRPQWSIPLGWRNGSTGGIR